MKRLVLGFWFLNCLTILVLWALTFSSGQAWERGLFEYQNGNIPVFHLTAELAMSIVTLIGLAGWVQRRPWGSLVAVLGSGMFAYSAINSLGWAIHNRPALAIPMVLSLVAVPPLVALALRRRP